MADSRKETRNFRTSTGRVITLSEGTAKIWDEQQQAKLKDGGGNRWANLGSLLQKTEALSQFGEKVQAIKTRNQKNSPHQSTPLAEEKNASPASEGVIRELTVRVLEYQDHLADQPHSAKITRKKHAVTALLLKLDNNDVIAFQKELVTQHREIKSHRTASMLTSWGLSEGEKMVRELKQILVGYGVAESYEAVAENCSELMEEYEKHLLAQLKKPHSEEDANLVQKQTAIVSLRSTLTTIGLKSFIADWELNKSTLKRERAHNYLTIKWSEFFKGKGMRFAESMEKYLEKVPAAMKARDLDMETVKPQKTR